MDDGRERERERERERLRGRGRGRGRGRAASSPAAASQQWLHDVFTLTDSFTTISRWDSAFVANDRSEADKVVVDVDDLGQASDKNAQSPKLLGVLTNLAMLDESILRSLWTALEPSQPVLSSSNARTLVEAISAHPRRPLRLAEVPGAIVDMRLQAASVPLGLSYISDQPLELAPCVGVEDIYTELWTNPKSDRRFPRVLGNVPRALRPDEPCGNLWAGMGASSSPARIFRFSNMLMSYRGLLFNATHLASIGDHPSIDRRRVADPFFAHGYLSNFIWAHASRRSEKELLQYHSKKGLSHFAADVDSCLEQQLGKGDLLPHFAPLVDAGRVAVYVLKIWTGNYYHFVTSELPGLLVARGHLAAEPDAVLVTSGLPHARQAVSLLGFPEDRVRFWTPCELLYADEVLVPLGLDARWPSAQTVTRIREGFMPMLVQPPAQDAAALRWKIFCNKCQKKKERKYNTGKSD